MKFGEKIGEMFGSFVVSPTTGEQNVAFSTVLGGIFTELRQDQVDNCKVVHLFRGESQLLGLSYLSMF